MRFWVFSIFLGFLALILFFCDFSKESQDPRTELSSEPAFQNWWNPATSRSLQCQKYERSLYQSGDSSWLDADGDGETSRAEILIRESATPVQFSKPGLVEFGSWIDSSDAQIWTKASELDIDHFVPLSEAHRSGAWKWDVDHKKDFANDLSIGGELWVMGASQNRSKGDSDPKEWLPKLTSYHLNYALRWCKVKREWNLETDSLEALTLLQIFVSAKIPLDSAIQLLSNPGYEADCNEVGVPRPEGCCRMCSEGKPCGNGCIPVNSTCHSEPGCACSE